MLSHHAMSFPVLRRAFSTSIRCSYKTKNIPEEIVTSTLTTPQRKRGRPKIIQDSEAKTELQTALTPKVDRRRKIRRDLPDNTLDLPPPSQWTDYFPTGGLALKGRISLANPDTAALVADSFVPSGSRDKVIIEAYPGEDPGIINPLYQWLTIPQRTWCTNSCFDAVTEGTNPENHRARRHRALPQLPEGAQCT